MQCFEIESKQVVFSNHALVQFDSRYRSTFPSRAPLKNTERTARKLLGKAREEGAISSVGKVRRLMQNGYVDVRYFLAECWRFVLKEDDDKFVVLTIEKDHFGGGG